MIEIVTWNIPNKNLERRYFATCWVTFQICICVLWSTWPDTITVFFFFLNMTSCSFVVWYECFRRTRCWPKKGGSTSIQNVTAMYQATWLHVSKDINVVAVFHKHVVWEQKCSNTLAPKLSETDCVTILCFSARVLVCTSFVVTLAHLHFYYSIYINMQCLFWPPV